MKKFLSILIISSLLAFYPEINSMTSSSVQKASTGVVRGNRFKKTTPRRSRIKSYKPRTIKSNTRTTVAKKTISSIYNEQINKLKEDNEKLRTELKSLEKIIDELNEEINELKVEADSKSVLDKVKEKLKGAVDTLAKFFTGGNSEGEPGGSGE